MWKAEAARPDGITENSLACWLVDHVTGRVLDANAAAATLYHSSHAQLSSFLLSSLVPSSADRRVLSVPTASEFVDGGVHQRADGTLFRAEVNVQPADRDGRAAWLITVVDVTERKRAEELLARSERQLSAAEEIAHVGSFEWEIETNSVRWSDELYRIYGLQPREFAATYEAFLERIHPDDRACIDAGVRRLVETGEPLETEERIIRPDGSVRILESRIHPASSPRRIVGVCRDVTELRAATEERDLLAREELEARRKAEAAHAEVTEILERITDAFVALDANGRYIYVNEKAAQSFGRHRDSLIGKHVWAELPETIGQPFQHACEEAMATQKAVSLEEYYPPRDKWFEHRIYPSPNGLAIYFQDITERRKRENEVRDLHERLRRTEEFSLVMVTLVSMEGYFTRVPPTLCKLLGYSEEELLATHVENLIHPDDVEDERKHRERIMRGEAKSLSIELRLLPRTGGVVWVDLNCSTVFDPAGRQTHFIVYMRDITERHRAEERIRHQALHDDLTGLANRVLFNDRLSQSIAHAARTDRRLAVLVFDLDDFKRVNGHFGQSFGDIVISEVAGRLRSALRTTDTIARLGGDEFAVIVDDLRDEEHARHVAHKTREIFGDAYSAGTSSVDVTCCIGMSVYPRDGHDPDTLFRNAESALTRAKESGSDNIRFFDESMSGRFRDRLRRERELHEAIDRSELTAYYQPILRSRDCKIIGVEALCRWNHPERGLVGPDEFIPLAEETRLIVPIGEFILRESCREVQKWIAQGYDIRLSVNLSVRQFQELNLLRSIDNILAETSFEPSRLEFEVTETVAMQNADLTMSLLRELRQRHISIAIDDFGVGQTSLIYLRQFPIDNIKIDKVFINDILTDGTDAAIVSTVITLAHTLGLCATAEGVEVDEQVTMLRDFGCDRLQGFHFSRPVPAASMNAILDAGARRQAPSGA